MTEYKEIREILDRWYEGLTVPDEERRLSEFFSEDRELPEDLEAERNMFRAIAAADEAETDIPAGLAARIDSALEAEMARERNAVSSPSRWRLRITAVCGAAACLMAGWLTIRTLVGTAPGLDNQSERMAVNAPAPSISPVKEAATYTVEPEPEPEPTAVSPDKGNVKSKPVYSAPKPVPHKRHLIAAEADIPADEDMFLSEAEEEQLIADNYHVVEDEREAYAILNSVFARLEGSMVEENYRIGDINAQYEMEMTKLYN